MTTEHKALKWHSSDLFLHFFHDVWSQSPISCHNSVYTWTFSCATNLAIGSSTNHFQTALVNPIFFQTTATCFTSLSDVFLPQSVKSSKVIWILSTKNRQRISDFLSEFLHFVLSYTVCLPAKQTCHNTTYLLQCQFALKFISFTNHILTPHLKLTLFC